MAEPIRDVSHEILQAVVKKGSDGFFPRADSAGLDIDRTRLDATLDLLRLGGFIEITDWVPQKGQGYRITDAGKQAAQKPDLLKRPAAAQRIETISLRGDQSEWNQADEVREAVLSPAFPIVTRILVGINVAIYLLVCFYNLQIGKTYANIVDGHIVSPGALVPYYFFALDRWWLLVTHMFLHSTPMHILMNMFCLFTLGNILEGRWGWRRFLILYFGSGLIGGVAVLLWATEPLRGSVGASGAIAGLLTSLGVWAWVHRRYLPPQFVEQHFRMVGINLILLVGIGFVLPNIGMAGHVGGAIGGAILSVPLTWLGPTSPVRHRIMGVVCLLLIAGVCVLALAMAPRPTERHAPQGNGERVWR